jgi:hypothetical protein
MCGNNPDRANVDDNAKRTHQETPQPLGLEGEATQDERPISCVGDGRKDEIASAPEKVKGHCQDEE